MEDYQPLIDIAVHIGALLLAAWIANFVAKKVMLKVIRKIADRSKSTWDNDLVEKKVFDRLSHVAPALIIYSLAPSFIKENDAVVAVLTKL